MYKNRFVSELPINEVKEYFDELRCKYPLTAEKSADFAICKERLVVQACKTLEQIDVLDKIRAEIEQVVEEESQYDKKWAQGLKYALKIIDKYKVESED